MENDKIMKDVETIWIASDFISTETSEQNSNLRWLVDLLNTPIEQSGKKVKVASAKYNDDWIFDRNKFISDAGFDYKPTNLHVDLEKTKLTSNMKSMVLDALGKQPFIIGYELSVATRNILSELKVPYLDIWLGPVRFLPDIIFAIRSNDEAINHFFLQNQILDDFIIAHANILKVQSYRGFSRSSLLLRDNTVVFAGQSLVDKALLFDGEMLNVLHFKDRFSDLCKQHREVLYARHPFVKEGDGEILRFVRSFRNVRIPQQTGYSLLANEGVTKVVSITSSFVTEAYYFGKEIEYLVEPKMSVLSKSTPYFQISHHLLLGSFWHNIFSDENKLPEDCFFLGKDRLRDALRFYWSYREIDKVEKLRSDFYNVNGQNR